jgi:hypothetical protein
LEGQKGADARDDGRLLVVGRHDDRDWRGVIRGKEFREPAVDLAPGVVGDLYEGYRVQEQVEPVEQQKVAQDGVVESENESFEAH